MAKARPAPVKVAAAVEVAPVAEAASPVILPKLGSIVLYRKTDTDLFPLLVTEVGDASFSGQVFHRGTEVEGVLDTTFGDAAGQCVSPD